MAALGHHGKIAIDPSGQRRFDSAEKQGDKGNDSAY
jgi:hypothetical protein